MKKITIYIIAVASVILFSCDDKKNRNKTILKRTYSFCREYPSQKSLYNISSFSDSLIFLSEENKKIERMKMRETDNGLFLIDEKWSIKYVYSFSSLNKVIEHKKNIFPLLRYDSKLIKIHTIPVSRKTYRIFEYEVDNNNPNVTMQNSFYLKDWGFIAYHIQEPFNVVVRACNIADSDIEPSHINLVTDSIVKIVYSRFTKTNYTSGSVK